MRTKNGTAALCGAALVLAMLTLEAPARADQTSDGETVEEIIGILRQKGLIDEEQQERLLMKHAAEGGGSTPTVGANALLDGWDFYGDFRLRHELFTYRTDTNGNHQDNRYRFRYRVRFGFEKQLTDTLDFGMRFATGGTPSSSEDRSTNQTLGSQEDFDYDSFRIDRAYVKWQLPETGGVKTRLVAGKIPNPFIWKNGKDAVIWDHDVQPEGGALMFSYPIDEGSELFANVGYFIDDENSTDADPKFIGAQLGGTTKLGDFTVGLRGTMYWWRSLDTAFITRSNEFGNLPTAYQNGKSRIGDIGGFIATDLSENWPVKVGGRYVMNFTADSGVCQLFDASGDGSADNVGCDGGGSGAPLGAAESVGDEDGAWSAGIEIGSSKKIAKLGFSYFYVEANSVMSLFTDSDVLDGFTNRRGWVIYGGRQLGPNTEFKFAYYKANYIENDTGGATGPLFFSTNNSKRSRLQTDIVFSF